MRFSTGVMHLREGRVDLALEEFKKAVKEDGKNPYFQKGLGLAYSAKREWKVAIAAFRKALELNPYYVDVRNDLGAALIGSGEREAGKKEFLTAFSDPTNPTPEMSARNLGQAYLEEKNYDEALNWYRTSVEPQQGLRGRLPGAGRRARGAWARTRRRWCSSRPRVAEIPKTPALAARARAGAAARRPLRRGARAPRGRGAQGPGRRRSGAKPPSSSKSVPK